MYKSEIRVSTINLLLEKVSGQNYGKYLYKIKLKKIRGFKDQIVTLDFPVTALIGPNGGGKTTILGSSACAYKSIKPGHFFARSGNLDDSMQNWTIEYELIDKDINQRDTVRRTASFRRYRWNRDSLNRDVAVFGVSRTVPATERIELRKFATSSFNVKPEDILEIEDTVSSAVEKILGKDISKYSNIRIDERGRVTLLAGKTKEGDQYSEFHFGAGESSVIRMVMKIESLRDNSLILIEEIENGLHPVATVRMVEYLIEIAERKKAQVIFTTHSDDALKPLPSKGIWAAIDEKVIQGKLDIHSLRTITGEIDAQLVIFTEDKFSKIWVESMLRSYGDVAVDLIEVHSAEGDGIAKELNKYHNKDPSVEFPSVCFIDGDSKQLASTKDKNFRLPGESPEAFIFDKVIEHLNEEEGTLAVALHQPYENQGKVSKIIRDIRRTNRDPHLLYSQVGKYLGLIPENIVVSGFTTVWSQNYKDEVIKLLDPIKDLIPMEKKASEDFETAIEISEDTNEINKKMTDSNEKSISAFVQQKLFS